MTITRRTKYTCLQASWNTNLSSKTGAKTTMAATETYNSTAETNATTVRSTSFYALTTKSPDDAITWDDATWILTSAFIIFTMQSGNVLSDNYLWSSAGALGYAFLVKTPEWRGNWRQNRGTICSMQRLWVHYLPRDKNHDAITVRLQNMLHFSPLFFILTTSKRRKLAFLWHCFRLTVRLMRQGVDFRTCMKCQQLMTHVHWSIQPRERTFAAFSRTTTKPICFKEGQIIAPLESKRTKQVLMFFLFFTNQNPCGVYKSVK